jgi:nucleoside-diphosphate-sugar epimerase
MSGVLVLGAQGFLGTPIWRRLARAGYDVYLHDRRVPDPRLLPGAPIMVLDLATAPLADVRQMIEVTGVDVVVNCAGITTASARELRGANVLVVERLLRVLARARGVRFIHLGSAAEYGLSQRGRPARETDTAAPVSDYGLSKLAATNLVVERATAEGLTAVVLRVFNPVGSGSPECSVAGRAALEIRRSLLLHRPTVELGRLDTWRDYIGVRDVAEAVVAAVATPGDPGIAEIFNVGRGIAIQTRQLVDELADIAGFTGEILGSADTSPERSRSVDWQQADIDAITSRYGFRPSQSLRDMLCDVWRGVPDDDRIAVNDQRPAVNR